LLTAAFRADILKRYTSLVSMLVGKKLLTQEEAVAVPQFRIVVTVHVKRVPEAPGVSSAVS